MKKIGLGQLTRKHEAGGADIQPHTFRTDLRSEDFQELQNQLMATKEKLGQRAPGRVRVDRIIEATIELLKEHKPADISIAVIADHAGITRTSIYAHFNSVDEILEQIAIRFVQQTGLQVERYVRRRKPTSLEQLVSLMIKAIQHYFNQPHLDKPGALARHIPFESRHLIREFDKVAALPYHTLWHTGWDVEPLSEEDPFRTLVILQSAVFEASIQRHGKITDLAVQQTTVTALDFIARAESLYGRGNINSTPAERIANAAEKLASHNDPAIMELAIAQIELLVATAQRMSGKAAKRPRAAA